MTTEHDWHSPPRPDPLADAYDAGYRDGLDERNSVVSGQAETIESMQDEIDTLTAERDELAKALEETVQIADILEMAAAGGAGFTDNWGTRIEQVARSARAALARRAG